MLPRHHRSITFIERPKDASHRGLGIVEIINSEFEEIILNIGNIGDDV